MEEKKPLISVIVPVYNVENYLHKCVDSILKQTLSDIELILVDDGSPDGSGAICDEYAQKDSRVKVIHKPNGGVSSARNAGIEAARGEWLCFVDGDDYIDATYLEDFGVNYTDADLYMQGYRKVKNENILSEYSFIGLESSEIEVVLAYSETHYIINSPCFKLYKNVLVKENNLRFDQSISYGEDHLFSLTYIYYIQKISLINKNGYYYVIHEGESLTRRAVPYREVVYYINEAKEKQKRILSIHADKKLEQAFDSSFIDNYFRAIKYFFTSYHKYTDYKDLLNSLTIENKMLDVCGWKRKMMIIMIDKLPPLITYFILSVI